MREMFLVFRRELLERVATRAFLIGTLIFPMVMGGMMVLPSLFEGGENRTIVVLDETGTDVGAALVARLGREPDAEGANQYDLRVITGAVAEHAAELDALAEAGQIDGYLVVPANLLTTSELRYRSTSVASPGVVRDIQSAASEVVRGERLRRAGIDLATVSEAVRPVRVENGRIGQVRAEGSDPGATMFATYLLAFAIYFMVFFYGVYVMRSVLEEKTSRIAEVLVSSLNPTYLMAGKILGVAGAALVQVGIWAAIITALIRSDWVAARIGADPSELLAGIGVAPAMLVPLLGFFILGFFLYASLFAALGASITTEQEAQSFQMLLLLPLIMPLMFFIPLTTDPLGRAATFMGIFPLTSPVAMPMRLAAMSIPTGQVLASLALLAVTLVVMSWMAGKIYRVGILSTGKRPSIRELARWMRMA